MKRPPHYGSGPVVWAGIIATTCLLLFVFQKILWLVVPFLLALILYYMMSPLVQRLEYGGISRDGAASMVTVAFLGAIGIGLLMLLPSLAESLSNGGGSIDRYSTAGLDLLRRSLEALEAEWPLLAKSHFADSVVRRADILGDRLAEHVEPLVMGIAAWTPSLLLAPFLSFFFLSDGRRFKRFLGNAVPNAFFERTLYLMHEVDQTARAYFQGLIQLTVLDTLTLAAGLWLMGFNSALTLALVCAVLAWIPFIGSIAGGLLVVLVAATDFPGTPSMAYWAVALFIFARLLDDFVYMPLTIGRNLHMHPLVTVLMIFVGGAVAGVPGLMMVLPVLGVVMVVGETIGKIVTDPRLIARHQHSRMLRKLQASADLGM